MNSGCQEIISYDEMCAVIQAEADKVGGIRQLCRRKHMRAWAPVYLALQGQRSISDKIALYFNYEKIVMFRRISHGAR